MSSGKAGPPAFDRAKLAPAKKLADAEAEALLARAQADHGRTPTDKQAFALRAEVAAAAAHRATSIKGAFPPPASSLLPPRDDERRRARTSRVLRWMPEGKVPLAPEL